MIEVRTAFSFSLLLDELARGLREDPLDPLQTEVIVVGDARGVPAWLRLGLATRLGIAASLRFPPAGAVVEELARTLLPNEQDLWRPENTDEEGDLAFHVYGLLDEPLTTEHAALGRYLRGASATQRIELAIRLARLFQSYARFRPELLEAWERGDPGAEQARHAPWQAALWRGLITGKVASRLAHTHRHVLAALSPDRPGLFFPDALPFRRLHVFGASRLPETVTRVLSAVSHWCPVTWYALDRRPPGPAGAPEPLPSPANGWNEARSAQLALLAPRSNVHPVVAGIPEFTGSGTDLWRLQASLTGRTWHPAPEARSPDGSWQVHICHSPFREVEVLRDLLLAAFEEIPNLRPDEVLVAVSDPDEYAPVIEAVFGQAVPEEPKIPFHIVHRASEVGRQLSETLLQVIALAESRFGVEEVMGLLATPAVRRRAGLAEADLSTARSWLVRTHVHWGLDGAQKSRHGLPESDVHTWREGLDRLLLGYMVGPERALTAGLLPEGGPSFGGAEMLGRFCDWFDALGLAVAGLREDRTAMQWGEAFTALAAGLFEPADPEEQRAFQRLLVALKDLRGEVSVLPLEAVAAYLAESLPVRTRADIYLTGRVTFADFHTFSGVPFRCVALLGLDDDRVPRRRRAPGFDLISQSPEPGDPLSDVSDRQAFFDLVLSASDRLLLLYQGRSQTDNTERAPSVLLAQLLEAGRTVFGNDTLERLRIEQHLQPFHWGYFQADSSRPHFSFSRPYAQAARTAGVNRPIEPFCPTVLPGPLAEASALEIRLADLELAWVNASQFFCRHRLGLTFPRDEAPLDSNEPMTLGALERYGLFESMLSLVLGRGRPVSQALDLLVAEGALPPAALGRAGVSQAAELLTGMLATLQEDVFRDPVPFELDLGAVRVVGELDLISDQRMVRYRPAQLKAKDEIRGWIRHLVLNVLVDRGASLPRLTTVRGLSQTLDLPGISDAESLLQGLLSEVPSMMQAPQPLFEHASRAFAEYRDKEGLANEVRNAFFGSSFRNAASADRGDPYVALCWRHLIATDASPLVAAETSERFESLSHLLWSPLLNRAIRSGR